jgi:tetratricopeptide (TPR) repeat protein
VSERLTKKQLKEDPLMKSTGETLDFVKDHTRTIVAVIAGLLILIVVVLFVRNASNAAEERAAGLLAEARGDLARGAFEPAAARLQQIVTDMGGTKSGEQALLVYGHVRYGQGRYQEAAGAYQQALESFDEDPILGVVARRGLAATLENMTRYEEAALHFQTLANTAPSDDIRTELRLDLARNYVRSGRLAEAKAIYEEIAKDFRNPPASSAARQRLAEIKHRQAG